MAYYVSRLQTTSVFRFVNKTACVSSWSDLLSSIDDHNLKENFTKTKNATDWVPRRIGQALKPATDHYINKEPSDRRSEVPKAAFNSNRSQVINCGSWEHTANRGVCHCYKQFHNLQKKLCGRSLFYFIEPSDHAVFHKTFVFCESMGKR